MLAMSEEELADLLRGRGFSAHYIEVELDKLRRYRGGGDEPERVVPPAVTDTAYTRASRRRRVEDS